MDEAEPGIHPERVVLKHLAEDRETLVQAQGGTELSGDAAADVDDVAMAFDQGVAKAGVLLVVLVDSLDIVGQETRDGLGEDP